MPRNHTDRLKKKNIVLLEGHDDCDFFHYYFRFLNLKSFQLIGCEGKDSLKNHVTAIKAQSNYSDLSNLIVVQDNDSDPTRRFIEICNNLKKAGIGSIPTAPYRIAGSNPAISIVLLPNENIPGDIEKLILETFEGNPVKKCSKEFISCFLSNNPHCTLKDTKLSKAELQAIMSVVTEEPCRDIGIAAQHNAWSFDHIKFHHLKVFFTQLENS